MDEASKNDNLNIPKRKPILTGHPNKKVKNDQLLYAIQVKGLSFSFPENRNLVTVLNRLTLNVPLGCIYALLGPSGSGKTTLIRSILGLAKPDSGEIRLFHRRLDSKNRHTLQIPGKDVGLMPQNYTLYADLTVLEQLNYHRALHNVDICKFSTFKLIDTMELGGQINQLVSTLSGGQTRRLSFACAIIHKPRLLMLDEPSVGLDPLLRRKMWQILTDYVRDCRASVLITTHYIEESRKAQICGFLRRGFILAEDNPEKLIKNFACKNLEDVFFKLCVKQKKQSRLFKRTSQKSDAKKQRKRLHELQQQFDSNPANAELDAFALNEMLKEEAIRRAIEYEANRTAMALKRAQNNEKKKKIDFLLQRKQPIALLRILRWFYQLSVVVKRIVVQTRRQKAAMFAQFFLPLISILLFNVCVGETPKDIQISIVNEEQPANLSAVYLAKLNPEMIRQVNYTNITLALESVRSGASWAVMRIPSNFSNALIERTQFQVENSNDEMANDTIFQSTIVLNADLTNKVLLITIQRSLELSFGKFLNETLIDMGYKPNLLSMPMRLQEVIYGSFYSFDSDNYYALKDYSLPGVLIILNYTIAFGLTVLVLAEENRQEMFERNAVIGISSTTIILGHLIVRMLLCHLNVALLLLLTKMLFYGPISTPIWYPFALLLAQSLTGLSHGVFSAAMCQDFFMGAVLSNGVLLMMFILSGVLWERESLPNYLKFISTIQPTTLPTETLRWMLNRGNHDLTDVKIYSGFLVSILYFLIFFSLAAILFKRKH